MGKQVSRRSKDKQDALRALRKAKRDLVRAYQRIARLSKPGDPQLDRGAVAGWAHELADEYGPAFMQAKGMVGFTLGRRMREGEMIDEDCLVVFVKRKLPPSKLKERILPRQIAKKGKRLGIDVVELRRFRRLAYPGSRLSPSGLEAPGTLGAYATDNQTGRPVALTAMHVTGYREYPAPGVAPLSLRVGSPSEPLGVLLEGTMTEVDAAKVEVADVGQVVPYIPGIGPIAGWREVVAEDENTYVRMSGAVTPFAHGKILYPRVSLPVLKLKDAILAEIPCAKGDSGAAILDLGQFVLGFLVGDAIFSAGGQSRLLAIFSPARLVQARLGCTI